MNPRLTDDDKGEITVSLDGKELRGWSYASDAERRAKMVQAREYVEGYCDGIARLAPELRTIREDAAETGKMLAIYAEEPDGNGQKSFMGCMVDCAAMTCISIAYPLRELCRHEWDHQAAVCHRCGMHEEDQTGVAS